MPGLSGLELLATAEGRGHHVPFLVMSAFFDAETERRLCEHPGVTGILRKPFDIRRLVDDVRAVLERPRAEAAAALPGDSATRLAARELPVRWERAFAIWQSSRGPASPEAGRGAARGERVPPRAPSARAGPTDVAAGEAAAC